MPPGQSGASNTAAQQRRALLRSFRKNTRRRWQLFSDAFPSTMGVGQYAGVVLPQVGMASAVYLYFQIRVTDTNAAPSLAKLPRGPFNFVKRVQLVTNLGSNNIWDCDGWNTAYNNLTKNLVSARQDAIMGNGYDVALGTSDYPATPRFQYPAVTVQNNVYNINFVLRLDISNGTGMNFTQGLFNLQAPQVQASINLQLGQLTDLYANASADVCTVSVNVTPLIEFFQIPNAQRQVALPSGALHCTLQQNLAVGVSPIPYLIPRQGILLRLQQETVLNGLLAMGGSSGQALTAGNPPTAGIDSYELKLMNSDSIYNQPWWLKRQIFLQEFGAAADFVGMDLHEFFGAMDMPARGDFRDAIDTEAVTTTAFNTYLNSAATLGSNNNYVNLTRELIIPFSMAAAGITQQAGA